jgi:hypothetical protein
MPAVRFTLEFKTRELRSLDVPVEIRKPNTTLVSTVLASETATLPAGRYYATARMPGGQQLIAPFEVADPAQQDPLVVTLAPDPEDASEHEWEEAAHFLGRSAAFQSAANQKPVVQARRSPLESADPFESMPPAAPAPPPGRIPLLRVFAGNVVSRSVALEPLAAVVAGRHEERERLVQFSVPPGAALLIAQLVQPGGEVQNMALPRSPETGVAFSICRNRSGEYRLDATLENSAAGLLLQYSAYGAAGTGATAGRSSAVDPERLLFDKVRDPIGATVGAYSILRIGDIRKLRDWTSHLRDWFTWLPDGSAICGEHQARIGNHAAAIDAFADIPQRGLPIFSDGLFYAVERTKLYARGKWKESRVDVKRAEGVFEALQRFAGLVRRQRPLTCYPGLDVTAPDTTPAPPDFGSANTIDLAQWFSAQGPGADPLAASGELMSR